MDRVEILPINRPQYTDIMPKIKLLENHPILRYEPPKMPVPAIFCVFSEFYKLQHSELHTTLIIDIYIAFIEKNGAASPEAKRKILQSRN